jgi:hypothetical protein
MWRPSKKTAIYKPESGLLLTRHWMCWCLHLGLTIWQNYTK